MPSINKGGYKLIYAFQKLIRIAVDRIMTGSWNAVKDHRANSTALEIGCRLPQNNNVDVFPRNARESPTSNPHTSTPTPDHLPTATHGAGDPRPGPNSQTATESVEPRFHEVGTGLHAATANGRSCPVQKSCTARCLSRSGTPIIVFQFPKVDGG